MAIPQGGNHNEVFLFISAVIFINVFCFLKKGIARNAIGSPPKSAPTSAYSMSPKLLSYFNINYNIHTMQDRQENLAFIYRN